MTHVLKIENLQVAVEGKPILRGVDRKSSMVKLCLIGLMGPVKVPWVRPLGHPKYEVTGGTITLYKTCWKWSR